MAIEDLSAGPDGASVPATSIEDILLRPDVCIGSVEKKTAVLWVYERDAMVLRPITYVPGLCNIFEYLVNAADNKYSSLKVQIHVEENSITVCKSGDVPVEILPEEGSVYVAEKIFIHPLTSTNFDNSVKKTTGGKNGMKLANIFSIEFVIENVNGKGRYKQV